MAEYIRSIGLEGINGYEVTVECDLNGGIPSFDVVGLPGAIVREARERVRSAIKNCGFMFPSNRITVNLAPANTRKESAVYDLPILLSILQKRGDLPNIPSDAAFIGELSLYGELRPAAGVLPMAMAAPELGIKKLFCPAENADEASLAEGIEVYPLNSLHELLDHLSGVNEIKPMPEWRPEEQQVKLLDYADVMGQESAKRALEIAAAGGHNILLIGPPGSGKSMLASRLPSILPSMTKAESLETTKIYSIAGMTSKSNPMIFTRPFRAPHHTVSSTGISGGGRIPRPGEISLAHNGVLFLDEFPEFSSDSLEVLRQPLENGNVTVTRVSGTTTFPSRFMLVCAMNPCKCGWYGHPSGRCTCSDKSVAQYQAKISGPLLDRIDLHIEVPSVKYDDLSRRKPAESSESIRARVNAARERQVKRFADLDGISCNAYIPPAKMAEMCPLGNGAEEFMRKAFIKMGLTARSHDRILRVARTIADIAGSEMIEVMHIAEAVQYRSLDRLMNNA